MRQFPIQQHSNQKAKNSLYKYRCNHKNQIIHQSRPEYRISKQLDKIIEPDKSNFPCLMFLFGFAVLVAPWFWWQAVHGDLNRPMESYYSFSNYKGWNIIVNFTMEQKIRVLYTNILRLLFSPIKLLNMNGNIASIFISLVLSLLTFFGFIRDMRIQLEPRPQPAETGPLPAAGRRRGGAAGAVGDRRGDAGHPQTPGQPSRALRRRGCLRTHHRRPPHRPSRGAVGATRSWPTPSGD